MCKIIVLIGVVFAVSIVSSRSAHVIKEAIGFPETEENQNLKNRENRQPVYMPATCAESELFYPGDQKDDWICDCRPAYLYHPATDKCWPAFKRGPCAEGQMLVLPKDSVLPICQRNPCFNDGFVFWSGACEKLGDTKPCDKLHPNAAALGVNATTLDVACVRLSLESRFGNEEKVVQCPHGGKRSVTGQCITV